MLVFDIDGTISLTRREESPPTEGETARAFGFQVFMPQHILDFMREREDIVLLSTWKLNSFDLSEAFGLGAKVALMADFTDKEGIAGKFEVIKALQPTLWADDHITTKMRAYSKEHGIITAIPREGYISAGSLKRLEKLLLTTATRERREADTLLRAVDPRS